MKAAINNLLCQRHPNEHCDVQQINCIFRRDGLDIPDRQRVISRTLTLNCEEALFPRDLGGLLRPIETKVATTRRSMQTVSPRTFSGLDQTTSA